MSEIIIDNPTQLKFTHKSLRADNVIFIPTPNNNSDLATMITDTTYYTIENDPGCRYKKVITPKVSVDGVMTNCYKVDNNPVPAKVCQYAINGVEQYEVDNTDRTVSFSSDRVKLGNSTIPDSDIFFKDSDNNPITLTVYNTNNSVELTDNATNPLFSFKVPSCVHKVEIEHNTNATGTDTSNKAKIHIDLDNSNNTYYINEKRDNDNNVYIATNKSGVSLKSVLSKDCYAEDGTLPIFKVELGKGNLYYVENFQESLGNSKTFANIDFNLYKFYQNNKVGENEHVYSFKENGGYTARSFATELPDYKIMMSYEKLDNKYKTGATQLVGVEGRQWTGLVLNPGTLSVDCNEPSTYYTNKASNFPGLYTFCTDILQDIITAGEGDTCTGCFFLEGTNHIFKINVAKSNDAWKSYTLTADDVANDLPVFIGGTKGTGDESYDDTCTSLLNFGALCDAFENAKTSSKNAKSNG